MERFLATCARYIHKRHGEEWSGIGLVFPNRRAGVFFTAYLQRELAAPVIGPKLATAGDFITGNTELKVAEKLRLISILYDIFKKHTQTSESFDDFYFWGEILLADFNDIDRYLVNAKDLFSNIADIREIESVFDYLTEDQKKALEYFWGSLLGAGGELGKKHLAFWEKLYPVYAGFRDELFRRKIGYPGMIDRYVVENPEKFLPAFNLKKYYIIGFNALNACEKKLFSDLAKQGRVEFLWDYDDYYLKDAGHEAGRFMRENLKMFPPPEDFVFDKQTFEKEKNIKLVAVSSQFGQSQQIPFFFKETEKDFAPEFDNTAVVLADESLLFSALGAIPAEKGTVNVTMGYPVKNSVIYGFLLLLTELLKNTRNDDKRGKVVYHRYATDILNHPILTTENDAVVKEFLRTVKVKNRITLALTEMDFSPVHRLIFEVPEKVEDYSSYFLRVLSALYEKITAENPADKINPEMLIAIHRSVEKLGALVRSVMTEQDRQISNTIYFRLFSQYLAGETVAFEGEPLSGIQLMGILETRCLDFKNLLILGLNENKWPRTFTAPSFIPHNIRKGFGLPGIDEQDAMYAYYFYRLVQRAGNITATYSILKEGINPGELSRYGYQLLYEPVHKPQRVNLGFRFLNLPAQPIVIKSSPQTAEILYNRFAAERLLSPSAINTYLRCSLQFYFQYVAGLPEAEEVKEEIDGVIFGRIFHDTMEDLYKPFAGKEIQSADIAKLQEDKNNIEKVIRKKIAKNYFMQDEKMGETIVLEGKSILIFENIKIYLNQLFEVDKAIAPFRLHELEKEHKIKLPVERGGQTRWIYLGGVIDRVDEVNGVLRVIDYKTGKVQSRSFKDIDELLKKNAKTPKKEVLQALIYTLVLAQEYGRKNIRPVIYGLHDLFDDSGKFSISIDKKEFSLEQVEEELTVKLQELAAELLSPETLFVQTPVSGHCSNCSYNEICRRY